ncbi:MAG: type II 3-dehydroquinate dehydratase [Schleiferiaceae bacterium]
MKIGIINGANLNALGTREPEVYGHMTLRDIENALSREFEDLSLEFFQSNLEGELVTQLQEWGKTQDALLINAGGYTHTSVVIADAVASCPIPVIEIHMSNIFAREDFRHVSLLGAHCKASISGMGWESYALGIEAAKRLLRK